MTLTNTVELMKSPDFKDRFMAEYFQTYIRYKGLKNMLKAWDSGRLDFKPACPRAIYRLQEKAMSDYLDVLETRAAIEGVDLEIIEEEDRNE